MVTTIPATWRPMSATSLPMVHREKNLKLNHRARPAIPQPIRDCTRVLDHDWVYQYWDRNDTLLYVGIAADAASRANKHRSGSIWWPFVKSGAAELVELRESERLEYVSILCDHPMFNSRHSRVPDERKVEYLARHEAWDLVDEFIRRTRLEYSGELHE